eukprot:gene3161-3460_t
MFTPFLLLTCFPSRNIWRFTLIWLISFAGIVISYALANQADAHALVYYIAISCLIYLALQRQSQRGEEERHELICREERLREEEIAMADQKMKQMVGNVAHDLKTPLSSFVGNIRLMQESVVEVLTCVQDGFVDAKRLDELFKLLFHCIQTSLQTNDFMLMTNLVEDGVASSSTIGIAVPGTPASSASSTISVTRHKYNTHMNRGSHSVTPIAELAPNLSEKSDDQNLDQNAGQSSRAECLQHDDTFLSTTRSENGLRSFKDCRHTFSHIQKYRSLMRRSYMQQIIRAPSSEEGFGNLASATTHSLLGESFQPSPSLDEEESAPVTSSASPSVKTRSFPSLRVPRNEFVASVTNHPFMVNTSSPRSTPATPATPNIVSGANSPRVDRLSKLHHLIIGVSASTDDSIQQEMADSGFDASLAKPFCLSDFLHMLEQLL